MGAGHSHQGGLGDSHGIQRRSCAWFANRCMYHVEDQDIRNLKIQVTLKQRCGPVADHVRQVQNASASSQSATSGLPAATPTQQQPPLDGSPQNLMNNQLQNNQLQNTNNMNQLPQSQQGQPQPTLHPSEYVNVTSDFAWQARVIGHHEIYLVQEHPHSGSGNLGVSLDVQRQIRDHNPNGNTLYTYNDRDHYEDGKTGLRFTQGGDIHDPPESLTDVHTPDGPFFRMAPFRPMYFMASLTEKVGDVTHRFQITLGVLRAYDGGHMLEASPPLNDGAANDVHTFTLPGGSQYEFSIRNVSDQPDKLAVQQLSEQHSALDTKAGKLRQNLVGTGFDGPEEFSEAQFAILGSIDAYGDTSECVTGVSAEYEDDEYLEEVYTRNPCCRSLNTLFEPYAKITYQLLLPLNGNWIAKPFQSSTCFAALSQHDPPIYRVCQPIELHLTCTDVSNGLIAPKLVLSVIEQDSMGRQTLGGYSVIDLPLWPGKHKLEGALWSPKGTVRHEMRQRFCGAYLPLLHTANVALSAEHKNPKNRFTMQAVANSRRVTFTLQVAQTEMPGGLGTAITDATKAANRAREIARSARGDQENRYMTMLPQPPEQKAPGYTTRRRRDVTMRGRQAV